jgi:DNA primase
MIPDEVVDRVAEAADIVQIIGEYVPLKRVGNSWRGPCPFHQGTNRNFSVMPNGGYTCFVCGEKGSLFTFLQKRLGLSFVESVKLVGEKVGIEVREVQSRQTEGPDPREPLWELNAAAAEYLQRMLWGDPSGRAAREYLESRNVSRETADRFGLGFAPREIGLLRTHLNTLGYDDARLLDAGLLVRREEIEEPRPRFRARLIFPIFDVSNRLAGFGGRLIGGEATHAPKYLNSSESLTFSKGKLLYGLNWARHAARRDDRIVLVEGYFDVVRLVAAGLETAVAPLGTALTDDQAALIARYTRNVFLLYDSDRAGLKATFRAGDALLQRGLSVRVATLPEGEDPDTYVDRHGLAALVAQLDAAVDVFDRKVQILERAGWFADLHRRRQAIDRLLPTIRAATDPLTRDIYVARASEASGVDRAVLLREVESGGAGPRRTPPDRAMPSAPRAEGAGGGRGGDAQDVIRGYDRRAGERRGRDPRRRDDRGIPKASAERELLRAMLVERQLIERIGERRGPSDFRHPIYRAIYEALLDDPEAELLDLSARLPDEPSYELARLVEEPDALQHIERTVEHSLLQLDLRDLEEDNDAVDHEITVARDDEKDQLLRRKLANQKQIQLLNEQLRRLARRPPDAA